MSSESKPGEVTMRVDGHIAVITVENETKMNSYTPEMMVQLADHLTRSTRMTTCGWPWSARQVSTQGPAWT